MLKKRERNRGNGSGGGESWRWHPGPFSINLAVNLFSQAIKLMRAKTRTRTCNNYRRAARPPAYTPGAQEASRESRLWLITISTSPLSHLCRSPVIKLTSSLSSWLPVAMAMGRFPILAPRGCRSLACVDAAPQQLAGWLGAPVIGI